MTLNPVRAIQRAILRKAARELRRKAVLRFDIYGTTDVRGSALWDAGCHIDPDDGDALLSAPPHALIVSCGQVSA